VVKSFAEKPAQVSGSVLRSIYDGCTALAWRRFQRVGAVTTTICVKAAAKGFIVAMGLAISASSFAATYPYKTHIEQNIDNHQVGWIDLDIAATGEVAVTASFSNGKQWSGNNFYSITRFRGKDGTLIKSVLQEKGLDGSGGGHAREGRVTNNFAFTSEQLANFDHVELQMGVRNCGMELIEMHNLNDWTFRTKKCEEPAAAAPSLRRESRVGY
jgi:hypothetical protein